MKRALQKFNPISLIIILMLFGGTVNAQNRSLAYINSILDAKNHAKFTQRTKIEQQSAAKNNSSAIDRLSQAKYVFVLFYRSSCPHCRRFDPILREYADDAGFAVRAYTFDGRSLPSFPHSVVVNQKLVGEYFGTGSQIDVPTLFIMNVQNMHVYPVSEGELTYSDLENRMNDLAPKIIENERRFARKRGQLHA